MTGKDLFEKTKKDSLTDNPDYPWAEWDNLSDDERAGWQRKAEEESGGKKADTTPKK